MTDARVDHAGISMKRRETMASVTAEEKKWWLNRAFAMQKEVDALQESARQSYELATRITAQYDKATGGGRSASQATGKMDKYIDASWLLRAKARELERVKSEIMLAIQTVSAADQRAVLICRHVNLSTWKEAAEKLGYSERQIYRIYAESIKNIRISRNKIQKAREKKMSVNGS